MGKQLKRPLPPDPAGPPYPTGRNAQRQTSSRPTQGGCGDSSYRVQRSVCFALSSPTNRRRYSMKWNMLGALIVGVCLTGQSYGFGLLDTMLGSGCGCDCCEQQCCCEKSCGCSDSCCGDGCCEASCGCGDDCCGDDCCGDGCCEASCGCASNCCCKEKRSCFLSKLFKRKSNCCCEASCGCSDGCCGNGCCEASCGCCGDNCCGGCSSSAAGQDETTNEAAPIPPAPVADPAARIAPPRRAVRASFVR